MVNPLFKKNAKQLAQNWKGAREKAKVSSFGSEIEDGRYFAVPTSAEVTESQSGRLQVAWEYSILEGENAGDLVRDYDGLETEDNIVWLMRKLARYGYDVNSLDLDDLDEVLKDIVKSKPTIRIRLKTKGEFQNCYVDKVISPMAEDAGDEEEEEAEKTAETVRKENKSKSKPKPEPEPEEEEEEEEEIEEEEEEEEEEIEEEEEEEEEDSEDSEEEFDLDEATLEEMVAFAEENDIKISDYLSKKDSKNIEKVRALLRSFAEESESDEDEDEEGGEVEIEVGMKVHYTYKGKEYTSEILKIDEEAEQVVCQPEGTSKLHKVSVEDIVVVDEGIDE